MDILGKKITEKTEKIYRELIDGFQYPVKFVKMNPEDTDDVTRPVAMDNGNKEFIVKLDVGLSDELFENALVRDVIYCKQMNDDAPQLFPNRNDDVDAMQISMMVSSVLMDINMENKLKEYDMHIDDVDTMRLSDLFEFLKSGMSDYNRKLYHVYAGLQITLLYFTTSKKKNIEEIIQTFMLSDPDAMSEIDKYVAVIEKYGVDDNRSMMRCMRKLVPAAGMKGRIKLIYEGKVSQL